MVQQPQPFISLDDAGGPRPDDADPDATGAEARRLMGGHGVFAKSLLLE